MKCRILLLMLFLCLLGVSAAFCQQDDKNAAIKNICATWIDTSGLIKILNVDKIDIVKINVGSSLIGLPVKGKSSVSIGKVKHAAKVSFNFSNYYDEPVVEWYYIKQGFTKLGVDIRQLIRCKLRDLLAGYGIDSVSLVIPFDDISIKGNDRDVIFDYDKTIDRGFSDSYPLDTKINGLTAYYTRLYKYFMAYRHKNNSSVNVNPVESDAEEMSFELSNVFGEVTGKFYELIDVEIRLKQHMRYSEICFELKNVKYGAGLISAPKEADDYVDAKKDFFREEWNYFAQLKIDLKQLIK